MPLLFAAAVSAAFEVSESAGILAGFVGGLGVVGFFALSLVKAITRKTTGWIVGCVISGILTVLLILGGIGAAFGSFAKEAMKKSGTASHRTKPVASADGTVTFQIPSTWEVMEAPAQKQVILRARLYYAGQHLIVVALPKAGYAGDLNSLDTVSTKALLATIKGGEASDPVSEPVGAYPAIRRRLVGDDTSVYFSATLETKDSYYRVVTLAAKSHELDAAPVLKQVTDSFTAVAGPPNP